MFLSALLTYKNGKGARGQNTWTPVQPVIDALDSAFDRSFVNAPQTNKRLYLGVDISGSMSSGVVAGVPGLTPRVAASAMAMAIARREPNYYLAAFSDVNGFFNWPSHRKNKKESNEKIVPLKVSAKDSLAKVCRTCDELPHGGTDCALPMLDALDKKMPVDCFHCFN